MKQTAQGQNNFTRNWIRYLERHRYFIFKWYPSVYIHLSSNKRKKFECKCLESQQLIPSKKIQSGPIAKNCFELNLYSLDVPSSWLKNHLKKNVTSIKTPRTARPSFFVSASSRVEYSSFMLTKCIWTERPKKGKFNKHEPGGGILKRVFLWGACTT